MPNATPRGRMSSKRRHHIFSEHCTGHNIAPCCVCGEPIHRANDRWIIEHRRPLALLGKDSNPNCAPAHYLCGLAKTAAEARTIAKAKRQSASAISERKPRPEKKRAFWKPDNAFYDWTTRRYVID